jgi:hypothetical protein
MKLRASRLERATAVEPPTTFVQMLDTNETYDVFIRDELPVTVDGSLTQLLMTPVM